MAFGLALGKPREWPASLALILAAVFAIGAIVDLGFSLVRSALESAALAEDAIASYSTYVEIRSEANVPMTFAAGVLAPAVLFGLRRRFT